jgi:hypothetical protein
MDLKQTDGFIKPTQLAENDNKMTAPINFQDPIDTLFKQIEYGFHYANAGMQPYTEAQYVKKKFRLILNTGSIPDACRDWQRRTPVNQTWADSDANLHGHNGNDASSPALPAAQGITLHM